MFLSDLKSEETKIQAKAHLSYLANSYFYNYNSYSLTSPKECKLMRAFAQINLSQFAVRSSGERSRLQQGDDSQISYLFSYLNRFNSFCKFDNGI